MKMNFKTLTALMAVTMTLSGCTNGSESSSSGAQNMNNSNVSTGQYAVNDNYEKPDSVDCEITFDGTSAEVSGNGAQAHEGVVTISRAGVFRLTGSSDNAKIQINAPENAEVTLLLDGVKLSCQNGSVIDCEKAKTLVIYVGENSENSLSDSAEYTFENGDDEPDGAVFSRADMVIAGGGKLSVTANYKDGVKCKDSLAINCGELEINAADDGITGKDYVLAQGGKITVNAGGDGIKSTNSEDADRGYVNILGGEINVISENDGIQAETALTVTDGKVTVHAGGDDADAEVVQSSQPFDFDRRGMTGSGSSANSTTDTESKKGVKAGGNIVIQGGEISVTSADDSVHSNANVTVSGGQLQLSSCDDGIHSDETLTISGGTIEVSKSYEGLEGKNIEISGGVVNVKAADDGLNAAGGDNGSVFGFDSSTNDYYILISGGEITVNALGDGVDSNGTITQNGGVLTVFGPTNSGNGALDYQKSYTIGGGTLIALGASGMAQAPSALSQPCISIYSEVSAGSEIEVRASDGSVILSVTTPKNCGSLIFSDSQFKSGENYDILANGTVLQTVTASDGVSGDGATGDNFGGGGFGGGFGNSGDGMQGGFKDRGNKFGGQLPEGEIPENGDTSGFGRQFPPSGEIPENGDTSGFGRQIPPNGEIPEKFGETGEIS